MNVRTRKGESRLSVRGGTPGRAPKKRSGIKKQPSRLPDRTKGGK